MYSAFNNRYHRNRLKFLHARSPFSKRLKEQRKKMYYRSFECTGKEKSLLWRRGDHFEVKKSGSTQNVHLDLSQLSSLL
ncbi:hypothetical protein J2Z22_003562 [Paenibacillus forsythiae]|uniref:Uncharacterized protein n=1 Tax=Paenibacillus forsythiae TaxID=365616 RepID=A0ABU3HAX3_9BACL|nr:hypothetical protein [Paenibacillus forsythiae]